MEIEKIVANCIFQHMTEDGIHDKMQAVYKAYHSIEKALFRIKNVILTALDMHLSVAFNTVNIETGHSKFGIKQ